MFCASWETYCKVRIVPSKRIFTDYTPYLLLRTIYKMVPHTLFILLNTSGFWSRDSRGFFKLYSCVLLLFLLESVVTILLRVQGVVFREQLKVSRKKDTPKFNGIQHASNVKQQSAIHGVVMEYSGNTC